MQLFAKRLGVSIKQHKIIYKLLDDIKVCKLLVVETTYFNALTMQALNPEWLVDQYLSGATVYLHKVDFDFFELDRRGSSSPPPLLPPAIPNNIMLPL